MIEEPKYDLLYGGTMRGNRRISKMVKFYFGYSDDIKVEMFGKMNSEDLEKEANKQGGGLRVPEYGPAVQFQEYSNKVTNTYAHIVIGDKWYEGNDMPQRCYQSIWASTVTFIDLELDPQKRVFKGSDFCSKFNYVNSREEVEKKLKALKENPAIRKKIIDEQFKAINFDEQTYCNNLVKLLTEHKDDYKSVTDEYINPKLTINTKKAKTIKKDIKVKKEKKENKIVLKTVDSIDDIIGNMF
jgi:hypothetical protein